MASDYTFSASKAEHSQLRGLNVCAHSHAHVQRHVYMHGCVSSPPRDQIRVPDDGASHETG